MDWKNRCYDSDFRFIFLSLNLNLHDSTSYRVIWYVRCIVSIYSRSSYNFDRNAIVMSIYHMQLNTVLTEITAFECWVSAANVEIGFIKWNILFHKVKKNIEQIRICEHSLSLRQFFYGKHSILLGNLILMGNFICMAQSGYPDDLKFLRLHAHTEKNLIAFIFGCHEFPNEYHRPYA